MNKKDNSTICGLRYFELEANAITTMSNSDDLRFHKYYNTYCKECCHMEDMCVYEEELNENQNG